MGDITLGRFTRLIRELQIFNADSTQSVILTTIDSPITGDAALQILSSTDIATNIIIDEDQIFAHSASGNVPFLKATDTGVFPLIVGNAFNNNISTGSGTTTLLTTPVNTRAFYRLNCWVFCSSVTGGTLTVRAAYTAIDGSASTFTFPVVVSLGFKSEGIGLIVCAPASNIVITAIVVGTITTQVLVGVEYMFGF